MNLVVARALIRDAFWQVLDDRVFRILAVVSCVLVLPWFLVGFKEDGVEALFGWTSYTYPEFFASIGAPMPRVENLQELIVESIQTFIMQSIAGTIGLTFAIAATAFFVPRMLEKGAADTLFSKPVGRFTLLIARYGAGVLFVGCLALLIALGMHTGFLLVSGYSDPKFLWSALTITYVFALVHSVSVLVAVFTRSSVAALLCTILFFACGGCVHTAWILFEHNHAQTAERTEGLEGEAEPDTRLGFLKDFVDVLHWTMPKTSDADYVVAKLRTAALGSPPVLSDESGLLSVEVDPKGFAREGPARLDLGTTPATWIARNAEGRETARLELTRVERPRSTANAATKFMQELEKAPNLAGKPEKVQFPAGQNLQIHWVRWSEKSESGDVRHRRGFAGLETQMFLIDARYIVEYGTADDVMSSLREFAQALRVERKSAENLEPGEWYAQEFGWTSRLRHNAFVSIGTSLLFVLVMLVLARWRLSRIDF